MSFGVTLSERLTAVRFRLANARAARAALRLAPATGFVSQPEPRSMGLFARGKQLVAGNLLFAGHLAQPGGRSPWDLTDPPADWQAEAQGFAWADDLAAVGTAEARRLAQDWTWGWIDRNGKGRGPGWAPDLTGRRVIRWVHHAIFLLQGRNKAASDAYFAALSRQTTFLARRWPATDPGLPRFEALTGLLCASLSLIGFEDQAAPAAAALTREAETGIDAQGALPSRNPEELLEVMTLLIWALRALAEADRPIPPGLSQAVDRIAPTLRVLRHADGGLARFHGGGRGMEGRLDQALAASGAPRPGGHSARAMGFLRLSGGRTTVVIDAADPPGGAARRVAHASTGAFELTSGRRPLIVSCGSGRPFGPDWHLAGRATQSHSALALNGFSSSRFGNRTSLGRLADLARVTALQVGAGEAALITLTHDGWVATHGLTATRELHLSSDGRRLGGTDTLAATTPEERARFDQVMTRSDLAGAAFAIRFHLHPDADATLDMGGNAVSIQLRSGEIWVFRHDSRATLSLEPSVYLEKGRLRPRPARQIVLTASAREAVTRIGWTLAKAQDTPLAIRDLDRDDPILL